MAKQPAPVLPQGLSVDPATGSLSPCTNHYEKRLSQVAEIYRDKDAHEAFLKEKGDIISYEVYEFVNTDAAGDVIFGTSILHPGKVGEEYFMTRGHSHARADRAEMYYCLSGSGLVLMESPQGETSAVAMNPQAVVYVPPYWKHRSVNTGETKLISLFVYPADAGHEYGEIAEKGMRKIVVEAGGKPVLRDNPACGKQ